MKTKRLVSLLSLLVAGSALPVFSQIPIRGYVVDGDSNAVPFAQVRFPGLSREAIVTNPQGYFEYHPSAQKAKDYFLKGGVDLFMTVEKEGMVPLDPPDGKIRLPHNADIQPHFRFVMVKKGSPLLARSERMLNYILRQKIQAAIEVKEQELSRRDVLAEEAQRLGVAKETLLTAVAEYKDRLRTSTDLNLRGLAALDDANEATEFKFRQQKLDRAEVNFREAKRKDELAVREGEAAQKRLPEIYYNLGLTLFAKARYDSAAVYFAKANIAAPRDAEKLNMLGVAWRELAQYERSLQSYQRALEIDTTAHGRNHPNVARELNNIADVLHSKGDYAGALEKYNQALRIDETYFSHSHPNVAIRLNNIAQVLADKGDYERALEKYNEALRIFEVYFDRNHPNVATVLNNIGLLLKAQGKYAEALEKYNMALRIVVASFGQNHPAVASKLNNIGEVLRAQGKYADAMEKYNEALHIDEACFGRNHPRVARKLNNIALVLLAQRNFDGALQKYNEALRINEACFGRNHPEVATLLNNIAGVLELKGDADGAFIKYQEALAINEQFWGRNHPDVAINLSGIARVLESKGDHAGSLAKLREALAINIKYFGHNHPNVAKRLHDIAFVLEKQGHFKEAVAKYDSALKIFETFLGADHPNTQTVRKNRERAFIASLPPQQQWPIRTQQQLAILRKPPRPLSAADSLQLCNGIGVGYNKQGKGDSALYYLHQALQIAERLRDQEMVGTLYNNLGSANKLKEDWPQTRQWLEKSLRHNRRVQGDSAAVMAHTYFHLAGVAQAEGQTNLSREYAQKSLALAERHKLKELVEEVDALLQEMKY